MGRSAAMLIAGLSGFVALSYEILWYRTFSLATGGTAPVFAFVLGSYLVGLAAGSFIAGALSRRADPARPGMLLVSVAAFILLANALGFLVLPAGALACTTGRCLVAPPDGRRGGGSAGRGAAPRLPRRGEA
jgi:spermidine synthase